MKQFLSISTSVLFILLFPLALAAQPSQDYRIQLHSGEFVPEKNIHTLSKASGVLRNSLFLEKHYVTIQFNSLPDNAMKAQLKASGVELIDYIPNYAFTAAISANINLNVLRSFPIRSIFQFSPLQKANREVLDKQVPPHAIPVTGYADVTITTYEKMSAERIKASFSSIGAIILEDIQIFRNYNIRIPQANLEKLVALPFVQWTEFIQAPRQNENLPGRTLHRVNVVSDGPRNLKGDGINVGIWDGGAIVSHLDFYPIGRVTQVEAGAASQHSSHCAGTILGRGLINPTARGMAPNANLFSWNFNGNIQTEMAAGIPANNLIVSSHSYNDGGTVSCNINGTQIQYTTVSRNTDLNLNNFPYHLHVHSSGNAGASCGNQFFTITGTGKSAKNNVVVGNLTSTEGLAGSSSCGPVQDGRVKPELVAMGTNVFSTSTPANTYATLSGTSMSTPGISGSLALLVQRYKQLNGNIVPPSTLIKNVACNSAHDLGNPGPDYKFGFGRVNVLNAVKILENNRYLYDPAGVSTGGVNNTLITIPAGTVRLKVMLTWNDPAAAANANPALVNNLDLTVIEGATTTLPWILDRNNPASNATQDVDNVSNIEQVTINNPPAGNYTLRVTGTSVPTGPQSFALTWIVDQPYIEVIYPNGPESFNPGTSEIITWDNAGVTGNQTVEYSLDNGGSWNTIGTVAAATTRLSWSVPFANTSTALVRVTSGSITDVSDVNFKILNIPTGFNVSGGAGCSSGEVSFTWNAVAGATHYDLYRLDENAGQFVVHTPNIAGTSHTATGLLPGTTMWFTIVAKNNTTGSISEKANAINATVSSGGGGLGAMGNITGQTTVCGTPSNIPYSTPSVTGATSYTWTAPPGAVIASGQGTNTVAINYLPGSSNGNVSVFASNGSCQTNTVTLPVTVSSGTLAEPTSGGDQSQTVCPGGTVPTLTATANAPTGHTVIWYNAATGGSVVASPTLSSIGTIIYYAASRNNTSGCESITRTPVVLTISSVAAASATAGGTTTFCQGGSVTLTANAGTTYVWQKDGTAISGATSQTYSATTSGSYAVVVTTGSCTSTSNAIVVTVNSLPAATISASGATSFCQGNSITLTASSGNAWLWSTGATTQSITVSTSGNYTVTVTNSSACSAISSATTVTVSPSPTVNITASPFTSLFPGLTTTLTANVTPPGTYTYTWFKNGVAVPGATSATLAGIDLDKLGSYTVTVTNTTGLSCSNTSPALAISDSATTRLFIYPSPNAGQFKIAYYTSGANASNRVIIYDAKGSHVYNRSYPITSPYQTMNVDMRQHGRGVYRVVLFDRLGKKLADGSVVIQ